MAVVHTLKPGSAIIIGETRIVLHDQEEKNVTLVIVTDERIEFEKNPRPKRKEDR